jgi:hypothetical protein
VLYEKLKKYPDSDSSFLFNGFSKGFSLCYYGPRISFMAKNLSSANRRPDIVSLKLNKEVEAGRMGGPFDEPPFPRFRVSPVGLVQKKESNDFRLIHHLSFPNKISVNDFIPQEFSSVQYMHFDEAVTMVQNLGRNALLAKTDIQSAFRLLPINPSDYDLLGIKHRGKYYFDKCLPFGASISCATFEKFSSFLEWCTKEKSGSNNVKHYLDDFLFGGRSKTLECKNLLADFVKLCDELCVPLAVKKTVQPTTVIVFLGLTLDTNRMEIRIPLSKIDELREKIHAMISKKKTTLRNVQSLIGSLSFACKAIPVGRPFLRRLIDLTAGKTPEQHHHLRVSNDIKDDLSTWLLFLSNFNGVSVIHEKVWQNNEDLQLFTDSSSQGFGIYFNGSWTNGPWPDKWVQAGVVRDIVVLEIFPIVAAVFLWPAKLENRKVIFRCDNMSVCHIINSMTCKSKIIMNFVRKFVLQCLKHNIWFKCKHIPGINNSIADSLSRFDFQRFRQLAPDAEKVAVPVPLQLLDIF